VESWFNPDEVRRRVPKGRKLPGQFDDFMGAKLLFRVEWNDLDAYALKPSATKEAVPFLRLPDGGLVALWYHAPEPAVVHIGGHGELKVIASDFGNFLKGFAGRCSGLPDIDESEESFSIPGCVGNRTALNLQRCKRSSTDGLSNIHHCFSLLERLKPNHSGSGSTRSRRT
jgi:hypothetical protein